MPPTSASPATWVLAGHLIGAVQQEGLDQDDQPVGLLLRGGRIERLIGGAEMPPPGARVLDFRPHYLAPGTLDVHTHGAVEHSFSSGSDDEIRAICRYRATTGATGLLATITGTPDELPGALAQLSKLVGRVDHGASLLGIHVEGPFLSPQRLGAISLPSLQPPSVDTLHRLQDAAGGAIRMMTVAPEVPGALTVIEEMQRLQIVPSLGHSDATYQQVLDGVAAGIAKATHTYNAMRPLHHRDPGCVGAVLAEPRIVAELIADGVHVHVGAMRALLAAKGTEGVALITDGVRYAGLPEGVYERHGRGRATVRDGGAYLDNGTLAGSVSPINRNLRLLRDLLDVSPADLFTMAAAVPARLLSLRAKGQLEAGADADFAIYDANLHCLATFVGGKAAYTANGATQHHQLSSYGL